MKRLEKIGVALLGAGSFACAFGAMHILVLDGGGIIRWGGIGLALMAVGVAALIAGES